ncbi:MAG: ABC transporter permease [Chloroflexota bacterium]
MRYLAGRLIQAALSILGVSTIVFFVLHLSGDPVLLLVPQNATAGDIARLRHQLGLDQPLWNQYVNFMAGLAHGNLGFSYVQGQPASTLVLDRLPYTVDLAVAALVLALLVGIPIGMLTAFYRGGWVERLLMPVILVGQSMPAFWSGILLIMIFAVRLRVLPSSGSGSLSSIILPAVTLASLSMATFARMTRSSFLEQLNREYVRTARSKGAGTLRVLVRHVFRNAAIPIITIVGLETANLLGGAVITETIFAWPGIGQLTVQSIAARDFPIVQAIVLLASAIYIFVNLFTDLVYGLVDPRIRLDKAAMAT